MSRSVFLLAFALFLPLMAGAGAAAGAGTFESVEEFAQAIGMKKGGWQTRVKVIAAEIRPSPAADPAHVAEVRALTQSQVGVVQEKDECSGASPQGRPRLPGILLDPECSFNRLQAADGRWSLSCAFSRNDEIATVESEGTYSRKKITGRHEGDIIQNGVVIHVKAETESRYVGKCRAPKPFDVTEGP